MSRSEQMFGCEIEAFMADLEGPLARNGLGMVLVSLLSDVQEMMAAGYVDDARRALNRVKYVMSQSLPMQADPHALTSTIEGLSQLRQLHADTTPGAWYVLPGRALVVCGEVSNSGYSGFDVLRGYAPSAKEAKKNAEFSATMHNLAPAVFEAIELAAAVQQDQDKRAADQRNAQLSAKADQVMAKVRQVLA